MTETEDLTDTGHITGTGQAKLAAAIEKRFGVTLDDVMGVRSQGLGWGEVFKVFQFAKLSGKTPSQIIAMRAGGAQGWGEIAKALGIQPGQGKDNLGQALKAQKSQGQTPTNKDKKNKGPSVTPTRPPAANQSNGNDDKPKDKGKNDQGKHNPHPGR